MSESRPPLRVLVIDDSVDNADALCEFLVVMGCAPAVAYSGLEGLSVALHFDPQLAIVDLEMPGMGGCELAQHMRSMRPDCRTRLICLTGRAHTDDRRLCREAGFDDFFTKPITTESLARALADASLGAQRV